MPVRLYQPSLMFADKATSLPKSGVLERCSFEKALALIASIRLGWKSYPGTKTSLFVNYGRKKFYNIGPRELGVQVFQVCSISTSAI